MACGAWYTVSGTRWCTLHGTRNTEHRYMVHGKRYTVVHSTWYTEHRHTVHGGAQYMYTEHTGTQAHGTTTTSPLLINYRHIGFRSLTSPTSCPGGGLICCCPLATKLWPTASIWRLLLSLGLIYCCPMANKLWPTASIRELLISYRLCVHHMLLPTGHQAVAHSLNYLGTPALLPGFCASYAVALWPPSCGPQPQFRYYCSHWASDIVALWPPSCGPLPQLGDY